MAFPKYYKKDIHVFVCSNNVESLGACFGFEDAVGGKKQSSPCPDRDENLPGANLQAPRTAMLQMARASSSPGFKCSESV